MAAKKCLRLYREALKASCVSQTRVVRTFMAKQHIYDAASSLAIDISINAARQTGKTTTRRAMAEYLEYYTAPVTAPSGRKKIVRKRLRPLSHNVNKNGRAYYQYITRSGE